MVNLEDNTGSFFRRKGRDLELEHLFDFQGLSISAEVNRDSADVLSPPYTLLYTLLYSQVVVHL
jgi:hypothetical protein